MIDIIAYIAMAILAASLLFLYGFDAMEVIKRWYNR